MKNYFPIGRIVTTVILTTGFIAGVLDVQAQDKSLGGLISKLNRLERDIQTLNRQVYKGGTPPKKIFSVSLQFADTGQRARPFHYMGHTPSRAHPDTRGGTPPGQGIP